jgi:DNA-binding NtrC family response regulator
MSSTPRTVLVVDDDALLRSSLESALGALGYRVLSTGDPDVAYQLLATEPADAVLLDVRLPTMSGLALYLAFVHRWPRLEGGIALMTGDADAADVRAWAERHPCTVIRKPFGFQQITHWLDSAVGVTGRRASAG